MASTCGYSPNARYRRVARLRVRPVPELGYCLVFTPAQPRLFTLNPAAWLALELCNGRSGHAVERSYAETLGGNASGPALRAEVRGILEDLEHKNIIERCGKPLVQRGTQERR